MGSIDPFKLIAPLYDRIFFKLRTDALYGQLKLPALCLLDVGGGTGRVTTGLNGVESIVIIDPSMAMLSAARQKKGLWLVNGKAEQMPLADNSFDRIVVVDAFHHFQDQERAVKELLRVLTPGGRLVIQEPDIRHWSVKLIALGERLVRMDSHFYDPEAIKKMFEIQGGRVFVNSDNNLTAWIVVEKPDTNAVDQDVK